MWVAQISTDFISTFEDVGHYEYDCFVFFGLSKHPAAQRREKSLRRLRSWSSKPLSHLVGGFLLKNVLTFLYNMKKHV